ncbi:diaminopimelate epimerase [Halomarina ordinaria]|uniref:Diaminopimelate epimerase n=1 Tax=Halomarina ordinaria TaxID=3033939 RepID=A0ABD5UAM3_9EURY|nr:diaminopimelate epimerase [Halomarina sp. PSRA2]
MIDVSKYHGTGNDFIVVDADHPVASRRRFAIDHCDRTDGISGATGPTGADGVLFLALEPAFDPPRVIMTLVQPDGSVASMCGNGARCAAAWAADRTDRDEVMIDTPAGTRRATVGDESVTIEMGTPRFDPAFVPLARDDPMVEEPLCGLTVTAVDTGVPHAVAFVDDVDAVDLAAVAPDVRHHEVFPEGANVTLASAHPDGGFRQRTFERGVEGETRSCGTGAVAIAAVARRVGRVEDDRLTVRPPGGDLTVSFEGEVASLSGPVVHEFDTELSAAHARHA